MMPLINKNTYDVLLQRYKDLDRQKSNGDKGGKEQIDIDIIGTIASRDNTKIDTDYMNTHFKKYIKTLSENDKDTISKAKAELHKMFANLSKEEQEIAEILLNEFDNGVIPDDSKSFRELIDERAYSKKIGQISAVAEAFGVSFEVLKEMMSGGVSEQNINEFGRFDKLKSNVDMAVVKAYLESVSSVEIKAKKVPVLLDEILRKFVLGGGGNLDKLAREVL